ncbi:hypothetical protein RO3G_03801 [Rhizopus delemar RA 99-880]|uniref:Uncharacterized protein n=1 Tax=Rhizopus delemar (strain RA 99-880 / ATCC MYA-4621 / FGSC 9543 / NRRL 43880) TaxID=246409 RepID=I1BSB6_RHIO9|nr:hypothetical protein RO3G_03801 [Rhizopus delemar RA 99-880]|eukprot:EIE79096.1 hypothetical protein RO3G_03801 [Rhizopus delemar RA 99-880]
MSQMSETWEKVAKRRIIPCASINMVVPQL